MDELEAVQKLASRARHETPPTGRDVTAAVLAGIRTRRPASVLPLSLVAATASLAATIVLVVAVYSVSAGADPQTALFPVVEVAQP